MDRRRWDLVTLMLAMWMDYTRQSTSHSGPLQAPGRIGATDMEATRPKTRTACDEWY